jgi:hypothetical protein
VGAAIGHGMVLAVVTVENKQPGVQSLAFQAHPAAWIFQLVHSGKIDANVSILHSPGFGIGGQRGLTNTKQTFKKFHHHLDLFDCYSSSFSTRQGT